MPIRTALLIAIVIAAALLRTVVMQSGFWGDEVTSIFSASQPNLAALVDRVAITEINPPLFFFLLHAWMLVAAHDDVLLKLLPLAFGIAIVPLTYALGRSLATPRVALLAAALAAANDTLALYSSELRPYSLATCCCCGTVILYLNWLRSGSRATLGAAILCATAGYYSTYLTALFVFALVGATVVLDRVRRTRFLGLTAFVCTPLVLFAPWLPVAKRQFGSGAPWYEPMAAFHRLVWIAFRGYQVLPFNVTLGSRLPHVVMNFLGLVAIGGLCALLVALKRREFSELTAAYDRTALAIVTATFLIVVCLEAAANLGSARYIVLALPFGLLGIAACLDVAFAMLQRSANVAGGGSRTADGFAGALAVAAIVFSGIVLAGDAREPKSGVRAVAASLGVPIPSDTFVLVAPDHAAETFAYYARNLDRVHGFPRWEDPDIYDLRGYGRLWNEPGLIDRAIDNVAFLQRRGYRKLIFVEIKKAGQPMERIGQLDYPKADELYERLKERYTLVSLDSYPGLAEPAVAALFALDGRRASR